MEKNIVITHQGLSVGRRYEIVVNGKLVGMMSTPQARFTLPRGAYFLTIRSGRYIPIGKKGKSLNLTVSTSTTFLSEDNAYTHITFSRSWLWWIYRIFKRKGYYNVNITNTKEAPLSFVHARLGYSGIWRSTKMRLLPSNNAFGNSNKSVL